MITHRAKSKGTYKVFGRFDFSKVLHSLWCVPKVRFVAGILPHKLAFFLSFNELALLREPSVGLRTPKMG